MGVCYSLVFSLAVNVLATCEPAQRVAEWPEGANAPEPQPVVLCVVAVPVIAGLAMHGKAGNGLIPQTSIWLSSCEMLKQFRSAW